MVRSMLAFNHVRGDEAARPTELIPEEVLTLAGTDHQTALPLIARDERLSAFMEDAASQMPTNHNVYLGDSRDMSNLDDESIHLTVTSPPYWNLKEYKSGKGQLGLIADYEEFLGELDHVWRHVHRVLYLVADSSSLSATCCFLANTADMSCFPCMHRFKNIAVSSVSIIWRPSSGTKLETLPTKWRTVDVSWVNPTSRMGLSRTTSNTSCSNESQGAIEVRLSSPGLCRSSPRAPSRVVSSDLGPPRSVDAEPPRPLPSGPGRKADPHVLLCRRHRARSFLGSGTTSVAAAKWGRNSVGYELEVEYLDLVKKRLEEEVRQPSLAFH